MNQITNSVTLQDINNEYDYFYQRFPSYYEIPWRNLLIKKPKYKHKLISTIIDLDVNVETILKYAPIHLPTNGTWVKFREIKDELYKKLGFTASSQLLNKFLVNEGLLKIYPTGDQLSFYYDKNTYHFKYFVDSFFLQNGLAVYKKSTYCNIQMELFWNKEGMIHYFTIKKPFLLNFIDIEKNK